MATPTITDISGEGSCYLVKWTLTTADPTGDAIPQQFVQFSDRSVQFEGTFGAATVIVEGSNDGANYEGLRSPDSVAISFTAAGLKAILETVMQMRPRLSVVGSGASIVVSMLMRRQNPLRT